MGRRRIKPEDGAAAVRAWRASTSGEGELPRPVLATAVRYLLEELTQRAPGRSVEVRVPPFGAAQAVAGPTHTRGTPPAVIETDAQTWLQVATGVVGWREALDDGRLRASGQRADLSRYLPLG